MLAPELEQEEPAVWVVAADLRSVKASRLVAVLVVVCQSRVAVRAELLQPQMDLAGSKSSKGR